jgi:hypothetical protein
VAATDILWFVVQGDCVQLREVIALMAHMTGVGRCRTVTFMIIIIIIIM